MILNIPHISMCDEKSVRKSYVRIIKDIHTDTANYKNRRTADENTIIMYNEAYDILKRYLKNGEVPEGSYREYHQSTVQVRKDYYISLIKSNLLMNYCNVISDECLGSDGIYYENKEISRDDIISNNIYTILHVEYKFSRKPSIYKEYKLHTGGVMELSENISDWVSLDEQVIINIAGSDKHIRFTTPKKDFRAISFDKNITSSITLRLHLMGKLYKI